MSVWKRGNKVTLKPSAIKDEVIAFATFSPDNNPIHLDHKYAISSIFMRIIVISSLVSSLFLELIANKMSGGDTIYLSQSLNNNKAPCFLDGIVAAFREIISIRCDKPIYILRKV
ncbi:MAG: MaoC/PaaZ C-terminal domain-containing protein [Colwellia sp.]|nr:MaoC/PaaZ C-terminal domain-containing protein [Colwellia sp.]